MFARSEDELAERHGFELKWEAPEGSVASGRNSDLEVRCETSDAPNRAKRDD